jgi:hypothetical protein
MWTAMTRRGGEDHPPPAGFEPKVAAQLERETGLLLGKPAAA